MEIAELLELARQRDASDVHLTVGQPPVIRVYGEMTPLRTAPLTTNDIHHMLHSIMSERQRTEFEQHLETDFSINLGESSRFRVNAFHTIHGPGAVFRTIPTKVKTLEDLGAPTVFFQLAHLHKGILLVTGPTGSGKSTTLSAIINEVNQKQAKHIITLEDPVEFVHKSQMSLVNQREIGTSTESFAKALKSALRQDPDIVLVGELRDIETMRLALTAAETGHLVIGTLHTSSAAQTVDRIIDVFPSEDKPMIRSMLSNSLEAVISQRLVKRADGKGRLPVYEILLATSAVRNLIREGKIPQIYSVMQVNSKLGMRTLKDSVIELLNKSLITKEAAKEVLNITNEDEGNQLAATGGGAIRPAEGQEASKRPTTPGNDGF